MTNPIFEVFINNELVTKAGITADFGVLSMIATWVRRQKEPNDECLTLTVGGLSSVENTSLDWYGSNLNIGDEIKIKIMDQGEIMVPNATDGSACRDEMTIADKLEYYYILQEELKDHLN